MGTAKATAFESCIWFARQYLGQPPAHQAQANALEIAYLSPEEKESLPTYGECGGLMYLCKELTWGGETHQMVGFFEASTVMHDRPQGRGYARFTARGPALWSADRGEQRAHEFHYARLSSNEPLTFARDITRGHGVDGNRDALVRKNTQAGFIHLRHAHQSPWVTDFLEFVASARQ